MPYVSGYKLLMSPIMTEITCVCMVWTGDMALCMQCINRCWSIICNRDVDVIWACA